MPKNFQIWILSALFLVTGVRAGAQIVITGPTNCIIPGRDYTYTVGGNWSSSDIPQMQWCAPGKIQANQSTCLTGAFQIHVIFDATFTSGTITLWAPSGSTSLTVTTAAGSLVDNGGVSPSSQTAFTGADPVTINAFPATGGNCEGLGYVYQWESATSATGPFTAIAGATSVPFNPPISATEKTTWFRRKTTYNGVTVYTQIGNVTYVNEPVSAGKLFYTTAGSYLPYGSSLSLSQLPGRGWQCTQSGISYRWWYKITTTGTPTLLGTGVELPANSLTIATFSIIIYRETICGGFTVKSNELIFNPLPLGPGSIYSDDTIAIAGIKPVIATSPGIGGKCATTSYQYIWQQSTNGTTWQNIGTGEAYPTAAPSFTSNMQIRRQITCGTEILYSNVLIFKTFTEDYLADNRSYITTNIVQQAGILDTASVAALNVGNKLKTATYFDGLGRLVQQVFQQGGGTGKDLVRISEYDEFGRETSKYLPYGYTAADTRSTAGNGKYKLQAVADQQAFYQSLFPGEPPVGKITYELSPLSRPLKEMQPGSSWVGSNRGVTSANQINTAADQVRVWNIAPGGISTPVTSKIYPAGTLYKTIVTNEQGNKEVSYENQDGQTILKKRQISGTASENHDGWLCTYYIYDDIGNLRCVLSPKAVELIKATWVLNTAILNGLCYQYQYDDKQRMVIKWTPGASPVYMVYDLRDRLVFFQDGNLLAKKQWHTTFYDELNRPTMTALYNKDITQGALQTSMNSATGSGILSTIIPGSSSVTVAWFDGRSVYQAADSILFVNGFDSGNGTFETLLSPSTTTVTTETNNPLPGILSADLYPLTYDYYDNYSFPGSQSFKSGEMTTLENGDNAISPEILTSPFSMLRSAHTGTKIRILGTNQWLTTTNYYDPKLRCIQVIEENISGSADVISNRFDFSGKLLSSRTSISNLQNALVPQPKVLSILSYDVNGRLLTIKKKLNNETTYTQIAQHTYNEIGQMKTKVQGDNLNTIKMDYNILGWRQGMNRKYVNNEETGYFGYELAYDKITSSITGTSYASPQYNGNIAGTIWKGSGDRRKYDFSYDVADRLLKADFLNNSSGTWNKTLIDYSVKIGDGLNAALAYDANGNILAMTQSGLKTTSSAIIDDLHYRYTDSSNQLKAVWDGSNDVNSTLGDFKEPVANNSANRTQDLADYAFDVNGNLISDKNKSIDSIIYNIYNLPERIVIHDKGKVEYLYDAVGKKVRKTVTDITQTPARKSVTDYGDGWAYQDDLLEYIDHEEGRIRYTDNTTFAYDYFIKDHLENVRMVLSENTEVNTYLATMETSSAAKESALFSNIDNTRSPKPVGYPSDTSQGGNQFVSKLNAKTGGNKVGPSLVLRVMPGDTIYIKAKAFYKSNGPNERKKPVVPEEMIASLANVFGETTTNVQVHEGLNVAVSSPFSANFTRADYERMKEKSSDDRKLNNTSAFLGYVLFDDQFKMVDENSGMKQVKKEPDQLQELSANQLVMSKTGFLYIYTNNESTDDVYFDDVMVIQATGHVLEETHYYPFGLPMAGISNRALSNFPENSKKFNSIEYTTDFELNTYDALYRNADPQLGRWWQIDPKPDVGESPYSMMADNPLVNTDPLGDTVRGSSRRDARRLMKIIRRTFKGREMRQVRRLFKRNGNTFTNINQSEFLDASAGLSDDQRALAEGYVKAINSTELHTVEVLKRNEKVRDQRSLQIGKTGAAIDDATGGGVNMVTSTGTHTVVITNSTAVINDYRDSNTGNSVPNINSSSGELLAHELLGHGVKHSQPGIGSQFLNAIQMSNLYHRVTGTGNLYRDGTFHKGTSGVPLTYPQASAVPTYFQQTNTYFSIIRSLMRLP